MYFIRLEAAFVSALLHAEDVSRCGSRSVILIYVRYLASSPREVSPAACGFCVSYYRLPGYVGCI